MSLIQFWDSWDIYYTIAELFYEKTILTYIYLSEKKYFIEFTFVDPSI